MTKRINNIIEVTLSILLLLTAVLFLTGCEDTLTAAIQEEIRLAEYTDNTVINLTGVPGTLTNETDLDITVAGAELVAYKYKLDNNSWSAEIDISIHLTASGLSEGSHVLLILAKHESGIWQQEADAESVSWTIDTTAPGSINMTTCSYSAGAGGIQLQWTTPAEQVLVLRSNSTIVTSPISGQVYNTGDIIGAATVVFKGTSDNYTDTAAGEGLRYYRSFAYDAAMNYAAGGTQLSDVAYDGYVYVNGNSGNDGDYGTSIAPKGSIQAGITTAGSAGIDTVRVTEGTYQSGGPVVTLVDGISLYGGYKTDDWSIRIPETYESIISDVYSSGSYSISAPRPALEAGSGITITTVVDGFTIKGGNVGAAESTYTTAVYIKSGGAPTIRNSTLIGGYSSSMSATSVGLTVNASSPVIEGNTIISGTGANKRGIYLLNSGAVIRANAVDGGDAYGNASYGIYISGTSGTMKLYNNTVANIRGSSTYGVYISAGTVDIFNNTIDGGQSDGTARAIYFTGGASVDFVNNILSGSEDNSVPAFGIYENTNSSPQGVRCNDFIKAPSDAGGGFYRSSAGTVYTTITGPTGLEYLYGLSYDEGGIPVSGNVAVSPNFADSDYRLGGSTPISVSQGGANLSGEGFSTDKDGNTRTFPWSMGAYEYD